MRLSESRWSWRGIIGFAWNNLCDTSSWIRIRSLTVDLTRALNFQMLLSAINRFSSESREHISMYSAAVLGLISRCLFLPKTIIAETPFLIIISLLKQLCQRRSYFCVNYSCDALNRTWTIGHIERIRWWDDLLWMSAPEQWFSLFTHVCKFMFAKRNMRSFRCLHAGFNSRAKRQCKYIGCNQIKRV